VIVVAGGTGRLGSILVGRLLDRGLPVRVLTRDAARAAHLGTGVGVATADVREPGSLAAAVSGAKVVVSAVHGFAGPGGVTPGSVDRDGNRNLVDAAAAVGAQVVLMSVIGAAPDAEMELFRMKAAAEEHLHGLGVNATVVRSSAFAELWGELVEGTAGRSGRPLVFGRGQNPVNFVSVRDVAALVEQVVTDPGARGTTWEIGGPDTVTMTQLAEAVQRLAGRDGSLRHIPPLALRVGAATVGRVRPAIGRQMRAALAMDHVDLTADSTRVRAVFPLLPCTSLEEALRGDRSSSAA
jgi:uncharacterized protein YbjT (DUF2867 family)